MDIQGAEFKSRFKYYEKPQNFSFFDVSSFAYMIFLRNIPLIPITFTSKLSNICLCHRIPDIFNSLLLISRYVRDKINIFIKSSKQILKGRGNSHILHDFDWWAFGINLQYILLLYSTLYYLVSCY